MPWRPASVHVVKSEAQLDEAKVFIIVQVRSDAKVLKPLYGCAVNESCKLSDGYTEFSSSKLNGGLPVPGEYLGAGVEASVGLKN